MRHKKPRRDYFVIFSSLISNSRTETPFTILTQKTNTNPTVALKWLKALVRAGMLEERFDFNSKRRYPGHTFTATRKGLAFSSQVLSLELSLLPVYNQPRHILPLEASS
jgi:predicted transcriptional regulator